MPSFPVKAMEKTCQWRSLGETVSTIRRGIWWDVRRLAAFRSNICGAKKRTGSFQEMQSGHSSIGRAAVRTIKQGEQDSGSSPDVLILHLKLHIDN